jgi:hypothetical protein
MLHNLAPRVIILDEAQCCPDYLRPLKACAS